MAKSLNFRGARSLGISPREGQIPGDLARGDQIPRGGEIPATLTQVVFKRHFSKLTRVEPGLVVFTRQSNPGRTRVSSVYTTETNPG